MLHPEERALLGAARDALVAVDEDDNIQFASDGALALLGWDESLLGQPLVTIIPERLRARHLEGFRRFVKGGVSRLEGRSVRVPARRADGSETALDLTIRVFRRPDGSKVAVASLSATPGQAVPRDLVFVQQSFEQRAYQLL